MHPPINHHQNVPKLIAILSIRTVDGLFSKLDCLLDKSPV